METPCSRDRETSAFYGPHQGRGFRCLLAANTDKVSALTLSAEQYFCGQLDKKSRRAGAGPSLVRAVSLLLAAAAGRQCAAQPSSASPVHSEPVLYCYLDGAIYTDLYKFSKNILSDLKIFPLNWPDQSLVKAQSKVRQTVTKQNSPKITTKTT